MTIIELVMTVAILGILASLVVPFTQMTVKRTKELELRRDLREIRTALDAYKKDYDELVKIKSLNKSGFPESLDKLVEGEDFGGASPLKKKYLRRIPVDPFNRPAAGEKPQWGLRSYTDDPESTNWGGEDVFDVYSLSEDTAIDGTKYKDW
ncbi:type II secretion system protein [Geobacter sp.]|uniref:type II secretion system protein n=1 Tax=Geobacter sp. TaxID=46610 RepID=UPI00261EC256|nr:type II secretion system protein [Geobacter sp.]